MNSDATPIEVNVSCPFCGEEFTTFVDPSEECQDYIEDCQVCCRPIRFNVTCSDGTIRSVQTERE